MQEQEIIHQLDSLTQKVDRLYSLLESMRADQQSARRSRLSKPKPAPITPEEMRQHQVKFGHLYEQWLRGDELAVQEELDKLQPDYLRRLADSNNLNVTSKMSKERVLHLIGARFREKKQLHGARASRAGGPS